MNALRYFSALLALSALPAAAQETRLGAEGFVSPPATLAEVDWLIGHWEGIGIEGAPAQESWLPPIAGTMVGTFVQQMAPGEDGTAGIRFTEHMYLTEQAGSLVLKLKHFNADLTGWEEKDDMLTFRLLEVRPCVAYFHALTLRCDEREDGRDGLVAAVWMQSGQELTFRFARMVPQADRGGEYTSCSKAETTQAMNACMGRLLARAEARRVRYLAAALERHADRPELVTRIEASDAAFTPYREAECDAVHQDWADGSIRGVMALSCRIAMTDRRTHRIWQNWLTYMDSTPPVLPEPRALQ